MAFIIDDILLLPVKGTAWLCKKIYEIAEHEMTDTSALHERLLELQTRYELEEIDDEEYQREEAKILEEMDAAQKYKEEHQVREIEGYRGTLRR